MRTIVFMTDPPYSTSELMRQVLQLSPVQSITVEQMRQRCKILDAIDAAGGAAIKLEEAQFSLLTGIIKEFPFNVAAPALMRVIDAILETPADKD